MHAYSFAAVTFCWPHLVQFYGGREWDFVFDVDIGEGLPPKKLAMDRVDNPYLVAQSFIAENELPPYFTEQVWRCQASEVVIRHRLVADYESMNVFHA